MQRKVQAGGLGGAVTVVIVWLLGLIGGLDIPAEVASAFTVIISTGLAYWITDGPTGAVSSMDEIPSKEPTGA